MQRGWPHFLLQLIFPLVITFWFNPESSCASIIYHLRAWSSLMDHILLHTQPHFILESDLLQIRPPSMPSRILVNFGSGIHFTLYIVCNSIVRKGRRWRCIHLVDHFEIFSNSYHVWKQYLVFFCYGHYLNFPVPEIILFLPTLSLPLSYISFSLSIPLPEH